MIDGIPATTPERTLLDLGRVVDQDRLESALEYCLRRWWVSLERLQARIDELGTQGHKGVAALRHLLTRRLSGTAPTESELETRMARVLRKARLPTPVRQLKVRLPGRGLVRLDFAFPEHLVALETDGRLHHLRDQCWNDDHARRSALAAAGWLCLVVTWERLHREPEKIVAELRAALKQRATFSQPAAISAADRENIDLP